MTAADEPERLKSDRVWIDASTYRSLRFDWSGRTLSEVARLAERRLIRVVMTAITYAEVGSLMKEMWAEANKGVQAASVVLGQINHPEAARAVADEAACLTAMRKAFDGWLSACRVVHLKTSPDLDAVMADYFAGHPPFGPGKKRHEFPDAFVVSSLRRHCEAHGQRIYVVSNDQDLKACCAPEGPLIATKSLNEVLSHGRGSSALHDLVSAAVSGSEDVRELVWDQVPGLDVRIPSGYRRGARVDFEVGRVSMYDMDVEEVVLDEVVGPMVRCTACLQATLEVYVRAEQEPVQVSEDDWDPGFRQAQNVHLTSPLTATVQATLLEADVVRIDAVDLDDSRVEFDCMDVVRAFG